MNSYFAFLTRFDSLDEIFDLKYCFFKFYKTFAPDFENFCYLVHLNDNMNDPLVDSNLGKKIISNITGSDDE